MSLFFASRWCYPRGHLSTSQGTLAVLVLLGQCLVKYIRIQAQGDNRPTDSNLGGLCLTLFLGTQARVSRYLSGWRTVELLSRTRAPTMSKTTSGALPRFPDRTRDLDDQAIPEISFATNLVTSKMLKRRRFSPTGQ